MRPILVPERPRRGAVGGLPMFSRNIEVFKFEAKPPTAKHQTLPKEGKMLLGGPLRSPQRAIHTTAAALHTWPLLQSPESALISRDLAPSPLTSARSGPQILVRHGPKGDGSSLNTFARSLLSGRTAAHVFRRRNTADAKFDVTAAVWSIHTH